ncbi:MAG: thioredoxin fold domain-containing protein [Proteobacteria bacterium]|nr:thioredoxin fold domain-containing protein [Pseudomonadota bacterium]
MRRLALTLAAALALAACSDKPAEPASATATVPAPANTADAYALAAKGHGFTVGSMMAANTIYVYFDTTCPHCAQLWQNSQPLLGQVKMVWMPVGLLRPQSLPQGATILASADPAAAMSAHEASVLAQGPGITPAKDLPEAVLAQVRENTDILNKLGSTSVPLVVYRNGKTGEHGQTSGALDTDHLKGLVGLN